ACAAAGVRGVQDWRRAAAAAADALDLRARAVGRHGPRRRVGRGEDDRRHRSPARNDFHPKLSGVAPSTGQKPRPGWPWLNVESVVVRISVPFWYALIVLPIISPRHTSPSAG